MFDHYLDGKAPLSQWLDLLEFQEAVYPENYNKLRFLENHDQPRIASRIQSGNDLVNFTAMLYFLKGTALVYAGQEWADEHLPSLFEREPINRETGRDLTPLMQTLSRIRHEALGANDAFFARAMDAENIAVLTRLGPSGKKVGVFSLKSLSAAVDADLPDGRYTNLIDGSDVTVRDGKIPCRGKPIILTLPV